MPAIEEVNTLSLIFVVLALAMSLALVTGRELSRTASELWVRGVPGETLMAGYLDDEEATKAAAHP